MTARPAASPYADAAALDRRLGDPCDATSPFGFAAAAGRDRCEEFPARFAAALHDDGLSLAFLPEDAGGTLTSFDRTLMRIRVAARRDVTVMPATMFSITAATCVLLAGTAEQRKQVVEVLAGGGAVAFALSEPDHGSDLVAGECRLDRDQDGGYRLTGAKWMVGLGDRCEMLYVVARTGARGPGAFSAVLLDATAAARARRQPPLTATGMRGIRHAGFRFDRQPVHTDALVGREGDGLATAMQAMQVVRVMSTAANLACADTGLRLAVDFARSHTVQGRPVIEHAAPRRDLAVAFTALAACDVVALAAARALHTAPQQQSVWSSVAKHVAGDLSEEALARCADVLGTRGLLQGHPHRSLEPGQPLGTSLVQGMFGKVRRDNAVVRHIDTAPVANSRLVAMQLASLTAGLAHGPGAVGSGPDPDRPARGPDRTPGLAARGPHRTPGLAARLRATFTLGADLPPYDPWALTLTTRGRDDVTHGLREVARTARDVLAAAGPDGARAASLVAQLDDAVAALPEALARGAADHGRAFGASTELLDLAASFCHLHAAAACVHLWWCNRGTPLFGEPAGSAGWLAAVLGHLLAKARGVTPRPSAADVDHAIRITTALHRGNRLFSAAAVPLAPSTPPPPATS